MFPNCQGRLVANMKHRNIITITALQILGLSLGFANTAIEELQAKLTQATKDQERVAILNELAWKYLQVDLEKANKASRDALKIIGSREWPQLQSDTYNRIANYHFQLGNYDSSSYFHENSYKLRRMGQDTASMAGAAYSCGISYARAGKSAKAESYFRKSIVLYEAVKDTHGVMRSSVQMAYVQIEQHHLVSADSTLRRFSTQGTLTTSDPKLKANYYLAQGDLLFAKGKFKRSLVPIRKALKHYEKQGTTEDQARILNTFGNIHYRLKQLDSSLFHYDSAAHLLNASKNEFLQLQVYSNLAQAQDIKGHINKAKKSFYKAFKLSKGIADSMGLSNLYKHYGDHLLTQQNIDSAVYYYERSARHVSNTDLTEKAEAYYNLHHVYKRLGNFQKASGALRKYSETQDSINKKLLRFIEYERITAQRISKLKLREAHVQQKETEEALKTNKLIFTLSITAILIILLLVVIALQREKHRRKLALKDKELSDKNKVLLEEKIDGLLKKQELRSIVNVLEIQEKERHRIAQDLHDRLGGMIATMKLLFEDVQQSLGDVQAQFSDTYVKALGVLDQAGDEVRKVAHDLVSGALKNHGLEVALKELADTIQQSESLSFQFICHGLTDRLSISQESHIYRIVQEIVSNTLKHAQASSITLQVLRDEDRLNIIYEDNGRGFDTNRAYDGMGLKGISSRVDKLNGQFDIDSGKGAGTTYNITINLNSSNNG